MHAIVTRIMLAPRKHCQALRLSKLALDNWVTADILRSRANSFVACEVQSWLWPMVPLCSGAVDQFLPVPNKGLSIEPAGSSQQASQDFNIVSKNSASSEKGPSVLP